MLVKVCEEIYSFAECALHEKLGYFGFEVLRDGAIDSAFSTAELELSFGTLRNIKHLGELVTALVGLGYRNVLEDFGVGHLNFDYKVSQPLEFVRDIVLRGEDRKVLVLSATFDRIRHCMRLILHRVPGEIPKHISSNDKAALGVAALALASQEKKLFLFDPVVPIGPSTRHACFHLIVLKKGMSSFAYVLGCDSAMAGRLVIHAEREFSLGELAQSGLIDQHTGRAFASLPDGRSGVLNAQLIKALAADTSLYSGYLNLSYGDRISSFISKRWPSITQKELEVVALLASGMTIKTAASRLGKSGTTTSIQARSALQKTGFRTMVEFLTYLNMMAI